jgi:hypothetical protein
MASGKEFLIKCGQRIADTIHQLPSTIRGQLKSWRDQIFGVFRKPVAVLSLIFAAIAFCGLRVYDNQISKIEYSKGRLAAKRAKNLLMRKQYVLHGYDSENVSQGKKNHRKRVVSSHTPAKKNSENSSDFQKTVDDFLCNHEISEVMCESGFCRMKIDDKMVETHSALATDLEIFIEDSDGDSVTFADSAGHKYSRSIESFLSR